jgi:hypothetical protein
MEFEEIVRRANLKLDEAERVTNYANVFRGLMANVARQGDAIDMVDFTRVDIVLNFVLPTQIGPIAAIYDLAVETVDSKEFLIGRYRFFIKQPLSEEQIHVSTVAFNARGDVLAGSPTKSLSTLDVGERFHNAARRAFVAQIVSDALNKLPRWPEAHD